MILLPLMLPTNRRSSLSLTYISESFQYAKPDEARYVQMVEFICGGHMGQRIIVMCATMALFSSFQTYAQTFPEGPGKQILESRCSGCHGPDVVRTYRHSAEEWQDEVTSMIDMGAKVSDDEFAVLVQYLTANWGPRGTNDSAAAPNIPSAVATAGDAQAPASQEQRELAKALSSVAVSLESALSAAATQGTPISAKFEMEHGALQLS